MSELSGIYALWFRELKVYTRERSRIISSIINPILWFVIIGGGIGSAVSFGGVNYQTFIYPGILIQSALFSSIFFGTYIVWDKKIDFMKEVLVAPISRTSMLVGKILGGSTDTLIQISLLLIIGFGFIQSGFLAGLHMNVISVITSFLILFVTTIGLVSLGLIIGSQMESPEGFQLIGTFVIFPMFFMSGALFPIDNLPPYLSQLVFINPVTYAVDGLRGAMLGISHFPVIFDLGIMALFSAIMILIGTYAFKKMKV
ncbi:MAG: ABC transporter permease [Candidatus Aenigmatarchaeota archaeon]